MSAAATDQVVAGRYRLTRLIAVGGMGEVWAARDERLARDVAVKLLRPELSRDQTFLARFRAEARHAAALSHPGIASVYDYGETPAHVYLVMELVDGEPLSALLRRDRVLPLSVALRVIGLTGLALEAAHDAGVIHRDIKPANLIVFDGPSGPEVKVTDFGIARATDSAPLTRTGMVMGTAHYLSPEQARAGAVTPASDVYSLGVVAYECLTGVRPFTGSTAYEVAAAHAHQPAPPLPADLPAEVRALVGAALAKNPADRPASAGELGRAALALAARAQGQHEVDRASADARGPAHTQVLPAVRAEATTPAGAATPARPPAPPRPRTRSRRVSARRVWFVVALAAVIGAAAALGLTKTTPRADNRGGVPGVGIVGASRLLSSADIGGPAGTVTRVLSATRREREMGEGGNGG